MALNIKDGWLAVDCHEPQYMIKHVVSPYFNARPLSGNIDLLVIHNISLPKGVYVADRVDGLFTGTLDHSVHPSFEELKGLEVSTHCLIDRDGHITQYVSFNDRAWHAGVSSYAERSGCNDFSIGIELLGCDDAAFSDAQYVSLAKLTRALLNAYPDIKRVPTKIADKSDVPYESVNTTESLEASRSECFHVVGHSDIAPGRKTDPGPFFRWAYYFSLIEGVS